MSNDIDKIQRRFREIAEEATQQLLTERKDVLAVYIYGSVARHEATPLSDIDLHVVLDQSKLPDPDHEKVSLGEIDVEFSYHSRMMYDVTKMPFEYTEEVIEIISQSEGLWELRQIDILYDPLDLLPQTQERAIEITEHPSVIRKRVGLTIAQLDSIMNLVQNSLKVDDTISAYSRLFHLAGGGTAKSGVVPLLSKAIIQGANLPLTTRRYFHRLYEAANKLDRYTWYESCAGILGITPGRVDLKIMRCTLSDLLNTINMLPELMPFLEIDMTMLKESGDPISHMAFLEQFEDICNYSSPEAACALLIGYSTWLFVDEQMNSLPWVLSSSKPLIGKIFSAIAPFAGIQGDTIQILNERFSEAQDLRHTIIGSLL